MLLQKSTDSGWRREADAPPSHPIWKRSLTRWGGSLGLAVAVGIVYFVAARLSLALVANPEGVAVLG